MSEPHGTQSIDDGDSERVNHAIGRRELLIKRAGIASYVAASILAVLAVLASQGFIVTLRRDRVPTAIKLGTVSALLFAAPSLSRRWYRTLAVRTVRAGIKISDHAKGIVAEAKRTAPGGKVSESDTLKSNQKE